MHRLLSAPTQYLRRPATVDSLNLWRRVGTEIPLSPVNPKHEKRKKLKNENEKEIPGKCKHSLSLFLCLCLKGGQREYLFMVIFYWCYYEGFITLTFDFYYWRHSQHLKITRVFKTCSGAVPAAVSCSAKFQCNARITMRQLVFLKKYLSFSRCGIYSDVARDWQAFMLYPSGVR